MIVLPRVIRADDKKKDLKPEPISLRTRDGFQLSGMYFPSDKGRKAVPVILIHEQGGQTGGYRDFAHGLQQAGFAVVYVDLRGHGASNKYLDARGNLSVWEHKGFSKRDVVAMVQSDLESVKVFLRDQNDEEKLNLNSLVLVGVGEGAIIALHWAVQDWDYPSIPGKKQGQDVKGFVLVSPAKLFGGVNYSQPLDHRIVSRLPMLIISGKGDDAIEAERIHKLQSKTRIGPSAAGVGVVDAKTLATSQSGSRLLTTPSITPVITELMVTFLNQNVVSHQDHFSWVKRSRD